MQPIRAQGRAQGLCPLHYQEHLKVLASGVQRNISRNGPCLVDGCDSPRRSRGLCSAHYHYSLRRATACPSCGSAMMGRGALCAQCHKAAVAAQMPTEKVCRGCQRTLPIDAFDLRRQRQGSAKWRSRCKECEAAGQRLKEKNGQRDRSTEQATASHSSLRSYAKRLGIPWADVVGRYPADNRCEVCRRTPQEAYSGDRYARLSLDHCHQTGRLRGFLCGPCNSGVGHLGDTPERLRAALKYLTKSQGDADRKTEHEGDQDALPGM